MTRYPCAFIFSGKPHTMQFVQTNRSCFGPWSAPLFGRETHIVTVLLLDLGNTALKWTTLDKPEEPQTYVHGGHGTPPDELLRTWSALKPTRVVGCMVSSEMLALSLTKFLTLTAFPGSGFIPNRSFAEILSSPTVMKTAGSLAATAGLPPSARQASIRDCLCWWCIWEQPQLWIPSSLKTVGWCLRRPDSAGAGHDV